MIENAKDTVSVETVTSDVNVEITSVNTEEKTMGKDEAMLAKAVSEMKEGHRYKLGQKLNVVLCW